MREYFFEIKQNIKKQKLEFRALLIFTNMHV